jgi:DNA-binding response OmpR family regulator
MPSAARGHTDHLAGDRGHWVRSPGVPLQPVEPDQRSASEAHEIVVLIAEQDPSLAKDLISALSAEGYGTRLARNGHAALNLASNDEPDLVIIDLGLPDLDAVEVCRRLRRWFVNPILVLSGGGSDCSRLRALDQGADDAVTKPIVLPELESGGIERRSAAHPRRRRHHRSRRARRRCSRSTD